MGKLQQAKVIGRVGEQIPGLHGLGEGFTINSRLQSASQVLGTPPGDQLCTDLTLRLSTLNSLACLFKREGIPSRTPESRAEKGCAEATLSL